MIEGYNYRATASFSSVLNHYANHYTNRIESETPEDLAERLVVVRHNIEAKYKILSGCFTTKYIQVHELSQ